MGDRVSDKTLSDLVREGAGVSKARPRDELIEYDPTMRERAASAIQSGMEGMGMNRSSARNHAQTIMGGANSGLPLGMGIADFVPFVGTSMGIEEGARDLGDAAKAIKRGDYIDAAGDTVGAAMGLIPGAHGTIKGTKDMLKKLKTIDLPKLKPIESDSVPKKSQSLKEWAMAGGGVPSSHKGRERVWHGKVRKMAAGGSVYDTIPDESEGGEIIPAYGGGGAVKQAVKDAVEGVVSGLKPMVDRINMHFKDVTKRVPELTEGAQRVKADEMSRAEYEKLVNKYKPVKPYDFVPKPATRDEAYNALTSDKRDMYGTPSGMLQAGDPVGLRLDIPAYSDHGVWVPAVHRQAAGFGAGDRIGYENIAGVMNPTFGMSEKAALSIAAGKPKGTIATIKGEWNPMDEATAMARAQEYLDHPEWAQVGMDPERHGYFYDRRSMQPVTEAEEAIQIGPLVLAKKPQYGNKKDFKYAGGGEAHMAGGGVPKRYKDRPDVWHKRVQKYAAGGEVFNTTPDMSDGGEIIQEQSFSKAGAVNMGVGGSVKSMIKNVLKKAPREDALKLAQERAALPASKGGLGLAADNTAQQRAKAMGFDRDTYHGSFKDIKKLDPRVGSTEAHAGKGVYSTDSPEDAGRNYASIYGPDPQARIERGFDKANKSMRKTHSRMRDEVLTPRQQEIILRNAIDADNLGVVYPLKIRSDKSIHLDKPDADELMVGPFQRYDEASDYFEDTPHTPKFKEALTEFQRRGGDANPIYELVQDYDTPLPASELFRVIKKVGDEGGVYDYFQGEPLSGGVAAGDFMKHFGVDEIRHTPQFMNQELNIGNEHTISLDPDNVRSRFAAFDPFRKSAAIASAMGVAAPDLLAKEKEKKKAEGGEVHMAKGGGAKDFVKGALKKVFGAADEVPKGVEPIVVRTPEERAVMDKWGQKQEQEAARQKKVERAAKESAGKSPEESIKPAKSKGPQGKVSADTYRKMAETQGDEAVLKAARAGEHLKPTKDGFVGAPRTVTNQRTLNSMRKGIDQDFSDSVDAVKLADPDRMGTWYDRAKQGMAQSTEPYQLPRTLEQHGVYSAGVSPENELAFALKHLNSRVAGKPEMAYRSAGMNTLDSAVAENRPANLGFKIGEYANKNDPRIPNEGLFGVNDFRRAQGMQYTLPDGSPWQGGVTGTMHPFMDAETALQVDRANKAGTGARRDWHGPHVQELPWVYGKAQDFHGRGVNSRYAGDELEGIKQSLRDANNTAQDYMYKHAASATHEAIPGASIGHVPQALNMTPEEKLAYGRQGRWDMPVPEATLNDFPEVGAGNRDILYSALGYRQLPSRQAEGLYTNSLGGVETNPMTIARPLMDFPTGGGGGRMADESSKMMDTAEQFRALMDAQEAGAYNLPNTMAGVKGKNAMVLDTRGMNPDILADPSAGVLPTAEQLSKVNTALGEASGKAKNEANALREKMPYGPPTKRVFKNLQSLDDAAGGYGATATNRGMLLFPYKSRSGSGGLNQIMKNAGPALEEAFPGAERQKAIASTGYVPGVGKRSKEGPQRTEPFSGEATSDVLSGFAKMHPTVAQNLSESEAVRAAIREKALRDAKMGGARGDIQETRRFFSEADWPKAVEMIRKGITPAAALAALGYSASSMAGDER
jgi:hypothetical protein